jgi:NitT/TauT family transport system substrate-binding protein
MKRLSFVLTAFLLLASLLPAAAPNANAQALTKLTVGMTPSDDAAAVLYAQSSGMFRRAGLDVDVQRIASGAATAAALAGGTFQFGSVSAVSAVTAVSKGLPLQFVAPSGLYNSTTEFVATLVRANSDFKTGKDFNGRVIGSVSLQDLNSIAMLTWIDQHGGDSKTVKVIEIPYSALIPALEEGKIDMATFIQPGLSMGLANGKLKVFAKTYDALAPRFYITAWMARNDWAASNPDTVRKFATVMREASIYVNAHHNETAPLVAPFAGIPLEQMLKGGRDTFATTYMEANGVQPIIDALYTNKQIDKKIDANDLIAPSARLK